MPPSSITDMTVEELRAFVEAIVEERLQSSTLFPIPGQQIHPWVQYAGVFKDDSDFNSIAEEIRDERQSVDDTDVDPSVYLIE
jgi:hypothetical protein